MSYTREDWGFTRALDDFFKQMAPLDVRSRSSVRSSRSRSPVRRSRSRSPVRADPGRRQIRFRSPERMLPMQDEKYDPVPRMKIQDERCDPRPQNIIQPYSERLSSYRAIKTYLSSVENKGDICALRENVFPCKKKIGSDSENGIIYRLYNRVQPRTRSRTSGNARMGILPTDFMVKVMDNITENRAEVSYTREFSNLVLKNTIPNFALCWEDRECKDTCTFIDTTTVSPEHKRTWDDIKARSCYLFFAELFHGDMNNFQNYLSPFSQANKEKVLVSFIAQIFITMALLDRYKLAHTDLHSGNVLFKRYSDEPDSAFVYHMKKMSVAVQHQSHLFAIWDVATLRKKGKKDLHDQISGAYSDLKNLFSWMSSYFDVTIENEQTGVNERNPNPSRIFKKLFLDLYEFCLDKHANNQPIDLERLFTNELPRILTIVGLRGVWGSVVQINTQLPEEVISENFNLSKLL